MAADGVTPPDCNSDTMHRHRVQCTGIRSSCRPKSANCRRALDQTQIEIMITYQHAGIVFRGQYQKDYGTTAGLC